MTPARGPRRSSERDLGGDLVVGRQAVRELLRAGRRRVRDVWLADGLAPAAVLADITERAQQDKTAEIARCNNGR